MEQMQTEAQLGEVYQQNYYAIVELLGRLTAQNATNFRTEKPRQQEHIGKQEEVIAALNGVMEIIEA
jgi:hypothetical protein